MEKHELVDINGNKTGKILTHIEARDPNNVPNGYYISVVGVVIINDEMKFYCRNVVDIKELILANGEYVVEK